MRRSFGVSLRAEADESESATATSVTILNDDLEIINITTKRDDIAVR